MTSAEGSAGMRIRNTVGGLLETVQVDNGGLVKEGQILATRETRVERATVPSSRRRQN